MITNVLEYLEESAKKSPRKIVLSDDNSQVTYEELLHDAKAIGSYLSSKINNKTNEPIAVLIDRNVESIIAFLGVIYSGNFYVPIDLSMPSNRINTIFNTLHPQFIIANNASSSKLGSIDFAGEVLPFSQMIDANIDINGLEKIRSAVIDTDPVYSIFTSGSTGIPKGVVICHRSIIDLIEHFSRAFNLSENCIFGNQAPFDFDVSVKDIYLTLKNGASLVIIPKVLFSFPGKLIEYLNSNKINTIIWATSALRIIANFQSFENIKPNHLQTIMFSGEVMPNKILNYWRRNLPDCQYVNLYGPTEITCNCSYYIVNRQFADNEVLPIGIPFKNTDIILLNENDKLVKKDEMGEICVRGSSLALGYYNNKQETSKSFCQNPLNKNYPELIYRTGDLGSYNERGELIFISRKDFQIKHMGHRIELGEIEVAANAVNFIDTACCLYDSNNEKIILFYQAKEQNDKEVVLCLKKSLPRFMIPNRFVFMKSMPMNKNAKIDRQKLKSEFIDETS